MPKDRYDENTEICDQREQILHIADMCDFDLDHLAEHLGIPIKGKVSLGLWRSAWKDDTGAKYAALANRYRLSDPDRNVRKDLFADAYKIMRDRALYGIRCDDCDQESEKGA